jgi:hypothetical protein
MAGKAGSTIGIVGTQPPIGAYVQDALFPTGNTNYTGVNTTTAWDTNVIEEDNVAGFVAPVTSDVASSDATWVQAGGTIAEGGAFDIVAGVTAAGTTHECFVIGGVVADQWFWAVLA